MTEPTISAIHHVAINVHEFQQPERWYIDVLGFIRLGPCAGAGFQLVLLRCPVPTFPSDTCGD